MNRMGLVYATIELISSDDLALSRRGFLPEDQVKRLYINALVDSGATMLAVPEFVKKQLDLQPLREIEAELADGSSSAYEVVGPVKVQFENRSAIVEALVVPGSTKVLLGAVPMQTMDVLVDPKRERLVVNPESPDIARMLLM